MISYADVSTGDAYFSTRTGSDAWDDAESADKEKALNHATRIVDTLNFVGIKADSTQENQFPRHGQTDVPDDIIFATCEIALALLDGVNPELELENLSQTNSGYANVKTTFNRDQLPEHILAGVPSSTAWRHLKPWLHDNRNLKLIRAS
jgi:hypothetical protein